MLVNMSRFHPRGLSGFVLTPIVGDEVDTQALDGLVRRAACAGVDSLGVLGSTGSYAYLDRRERAIVLETTVAAAGSTPVIAGVGALRTRHMIDYAKDAQAAGAAAVLVPVMTYQPLSDDEALSMYQALAEAVDLPIVVYDNPGTTHFAFSDELYVRIAEIPTVFSIKIPPTRLPSDAAAARASIDALRARLPERVSLGISGDAVGALGLLSGCSVWYSTLGATVVEPLLHIARLAQSGDRLALELSARLQPLWDQFAAHGSMRVTATIASLKGLTPEYSTPSPVQELRGNDRTVLADAMALLGL